MNITATTVVTQVAGLITTMVDDSLVILSMDADRYVALDSVGQHIWQLVQEPKSVADLVRELQLDYTGDPERIEADLMAFLDQLRDDRVIELS